MRVGVLGGSFNPPHVGHVLAAALVRSWGLVDRVLVMPVFVHPFAKDLAPFEQRLAMCERAFSLIDGVMTSDLERQLGGESLTLRTLRALVAQHPGDTFRLLIGSDVLPDLPKWHRFDLIEQLAPPLVFDRAGAAQDEGRVLLPQVSSTEIRRLVAAADASAWRRLVPGGVADFIEENGLYREAGS